MAQIVLGIGTSHTPMLNAAADEWPLWDMRRPAPGLALAIFRVQGDTA
jgi:hypothetical protein